VATIYDVARRAGVSPATVSRVLNGAAASEAKAEAVRRAAEELSYTPNRAARTLRTQSAEVISLIIPDIENPYFTEMARGVEDVASEAGYSVVLCNSDAEVEKEATYLRIAVAEHMSGVILAATNEHPDLGVVRGAGRPVVAVDRATADDIDRVLMPNHEAGLSATAHLLKDYSRVAYIGGPEHVQTARERAEGWREAHRRRGSEAPADLLRFDSFLVDGGRRVMEELLGLPEPPDAVVAGNNLIGVGVLQVLGERGLTPPRVGVAVIGSLPFTTLSPTAVTIIRLPAREMGTTAARLLLDRIAGEDGPSRTVVLQAELRPAADPSSPLPIADDGAVT
jgi:LacI family transcriptional regulator